MDTKSLVYSRNVVEFATVAKEYCAFLENAQDHTRKSFINAAHKLLPLLYYKASVLPEVQPLLDDSNEKFVDEEIYENIRTKLLALFGQYDEFLEVNDIRAKEGEGVFVANNSEYLSDIYQDLKNFTILFQVGSVDVMNDALWECKSNFEEFWGIRLANTIRSLHNLFYSDTELDKQDDKPVKDEPDTSQWFIAQRQKDFPIE